MKSKLKEESKRNDEELRKEVDHLMMRKVYLKYLIMRVRSKISYIAFKKRVTVAELFFK